MYTQQVTKVILLPVQNMVGVCKQITLLFLYYQMPTYINNYVVVAISIIKGYSWYTQNVN